MALYEPSPIRQVEIDFGTIPQPEGAFPITDSLVTPSSRIIAMVAYEAPTGKDLDELEMDSIDIKAGPGSGTLTLYIKGHEGYLADKFKINYIVL